MFPKKFINDEKFQLMNHNAVHFRSDLTIKKVVNLILKMGVAAFVTPDNAAAGYNESAYNDNRIAGRINMRTRAGCCSFTKDPSQFYLFPIHTAQLTNVGLTDDDLVKWIMWLNGAKMGFKYLYLGKQEGNESMNNAWVSIKDSWGKVRVQQDCPTNEFHWILVPRFAEGTDFKKTYMHWICLRWLINTRASNDNFGNFGEGSTRWGYHQIPRIAMMLNEDFGLTRLKSILYAHITHPFYYYYSLFYSDYLNMPERKPDVSVTNAEFKKMMSVQSYDGAMNSVFTSYNNNNGISKKAIGRALHAPYDHMTVMRLFREGNYQDMIKHIEGSYKTANLKLKKNATKKKTVNS